MSLSERWFQREYVVPFELHYRREGMSIVFKVSLIQIKVDLVFSKENQLAYHVNDETTPLCEGG